VPARARTYAQRATRGARGAGERSAGTARRCRCGVAGPALRRGDVGSPAPCAAGPVPVALRVSQACPRTTGGPAGERPIRTTRGVDGASAGAVAEQLLAAAPGPTRPGPRGASEGRYLSSSYHPLLCLTH